MPFVSSQTNPDRTMASLNTYKGFQLIVEAFEYKGYSELDTIPEWFEQLLSSDNPEHLVEMINVNGKMTLFAFHWSQIKPKKFFEQTALQAVNFAERMKVDVPYTEIPENCMVFRVKSNLDTKREIPALKEIYWMPKTTFDMMFIPVKETNGVRTGFATTDVLSPAT